MVNKNNFINIIKTKFDVYDCKNCKLKFQDIDVLNSHICEHLTNICNICNKKLKSEIGVKDHKRHVHKIF